MSDIADSINFEISEVLLRKGYSESICLSAIRNDYTIHDLRDHQWEDIDWTNLIEEWESMGHNGKQALVSLVTRLLEHLLKLADGESEKVRMGQHWASKIVYFRAQIQDRLENSISLCSQLEDF